MRRLIIHWTAGTYKPNACDLEHYHYLIGYEKTPKERGVLYRGKFTPEDNETCKDGKYAAHAGGGNTGSIGVALCAMYGYQDIRHIGTYPIKPVQMELCYLLCAKLCEKYDIELEKATLLTHYEFGKKHPNTTSKGKIDITYLASNPSLPAGQIGDFIRGKVRWYFERLHLPKYKKELEIIDS